MIGFIILLVIGLVVMVKFGRDILLGRQSQSWPKTSGTVMQSGLHTYHDTDDDGNSTTTYGVSVRYSYTVTGQQYESDRRTFSEVRTGSMRRTQQILDRLPQGGSVEVYYDPANPSSSVLEAGVGASTYALLAFSIVLVIAGTLGALGVFG